MARLPRSRLAGAALVLLLPLGCEGTIGAPSPLTADPGPGVEPPEVPPIEDPDFDPFEEGGVTIGILCGPSGPETRMVFTREPATCQRHAEILANGLTNGDQAVVATPVVNGPTQFSADGELCLDGRCTPRTVAVEIDAFGPAGAIGRWAAAVDGRTAGGQLSATVCRYDAHLPGRDPSLVPDLALTEVAAYQSVRIPLMEGGVEAPAPELVAGRPVLVRAFVQPQAGFLQRRVNGELSWDPGDGRGPARVIDSVEVAIASREQNEGTTFDFLVDGDRVSPGATWSIALRGAEACAGLGAETSGARFPSSGRTEVAVQEIGALDVTLVPFRYNADGSGRLPDTSEVQLQRYRDVLYGMFPVSDVAITVREPVDLQLEVTPSATTWSRVLQFLFQIRAQDNPPPNTYYYGIVAPIEGSGWSGVAGLGPLPSAPDVARRGAIGLGFTGLSSARTCAHELGHAAGRAHAPCGGAGNPDPEFPYDEGSIGVWGYDLVSGELKNPDAHSDFMGYCRNDWISDYNYFALQRRYAFVNQSSAFTIGPPTWWRTLLLQADGGHRWSEEVSYPEPPYGEESTPIVYLDPMGAPIAEAVAVLTFLDHADDVIAFLPAAPPGAVAVEIDGRVFPY